MTLRHFYPRPPRGGRPGRFCVLSTFYDISIHALREEGDQIEKMKKSQTVKFLSTPSARRATSTGTWGRAGPCNFYPRPPRGGRL